MRSDLRHWLALATAPGVGPALFRRLCRRFGDPRTALEAASNGELAAVPGVTVETAAALADFDEAVRAAEWTLADLKHAGCRAVTSEDGEYPPALLELPDPPPLLMVRGRLPGPDDKTFSVAGSSHPSRRGREIADLAGVEIAHAGWTLVSGYATGIDSAAHLGALAAGGRTVLVLPTGILAFRLRAPFRAFELELGRRITLVSECAAEEPWRAVHAVRRNRLIAALGRGLLVVEARPESGTMITFRDAVGLGRPAYVVRFHEPPTGAEGNELAIRRGGMPIAGMSDLRGVLASDELPRTLPKATQGELY